MKISPLILVSLAVCGCATAATSTARPAAPRYQLAKAPEPPILVRRWALATGVIVGGDPMSISVIASQDVKTGKIEGTFFGTRANVTNASFLGRVTGGNIVRESRSAHLTGALMEGQPFTVDVQLQAPGGAGVSTVLIPGVTPASGQMHAGDIRIVQGLPAGQDFRGTPGVVFDYRVGIFVPAADAPDGNTEPESVPVDEFVAVPPDPIELPNASFPGNFNAVPGIGFDVPVYLGDSPFFPLGAPVLDPNHPMLLGVKLFGA